MATAPLPALPPALLWLYLPLLRLYLRLTSASAPASASTLPFVFVFSPHPQPKLRGGALRPVGCGRDVLVANSSWGLDTGQLVVASNGSLSEAVPLGDSPA